MLKTKKSHIGFIFIFYVICFVLRAVEYFVIKTDQGFLGEAFIHKLVGIALLVLAVWLLKYKWSEIGFRTKGALKGTLLGLGFGLLVYTVAYCVEILILAANNNTIALSFFAASYTTQGNASMQSGIGFILICIAGNIINVVMEEGVFRGLFMRAAQPKLSFLKACLLSSALFGVWHIIAPLRSAVTGEQSPMGALMTGLMLVITSMLGGIQYVLLYKLTGTLWFSMAAHFVNNTIINLLHVLTPAGADEMQTVRITIAQSISCVAVFLVYISKTQRRKKKMA